MQVLFTLKLEAEGGAIKEIIKEGLRIAKLMSVYVETTINGVDLTIHPLDDEFEIYQNFKAEQEEQSMANKS
jgi:hypothetical protein